MIQFDRILAPTDFSEHAEKALRAAFDLAERFQADLHVLHLLSEIVPTGPEPLLAPVMPPQFYEEDEARAKATLAALAKPDWGKPKSLTTAVRWGTPVDGVLNYAAEQRVDLIVISTHGRTGLGHVLLGSVAEKLVREAACPVLTMREPGRSS